MLSHQVLENNVLNHKFNLLKFKAQSPFTAKPGQYVNICVQDGIFRSYSFFSLPRKNLWEIFVDITPGGPGTTYLKALQPRDTLHTGKPQGSFSLTDDKSQNLFFAATGCGIAPFKPMVEKSLLLKKNEVFLFWGLRQQKDIVLDKLLQDWSRKFPQFSYSISLSQPEADWPGSRGYVTEPLIRELKKRILTSSVYLSGSKDFIADSFQKLDNLRFPLQKIHFEACY